MKFKGKGHVSLLFFDLIILTINSEGHHTAAIATVQVDCNLDPKMLTSVYAYIYAHQVREVFSGSVNLWYCRDGRHSRMCYQMKLLVLYRSLLM